jgi:hypothetical protein
MREQDDSEGDGMPPETEAFFVVRPSFSPGTSRLDNHMKKLISYLRNQTYL